MLADIERLSGLALLHNPACLAGITAAQRVLGLAQRQLERVSEAYRADALEQDLVFLGLVAMKDPLQPKAKAAVPLFLDAGIRTVMITGDHKDTAAAITAGLGLMKAGE